MQRIRTVLIKLTELAQRRNDRTVLDIDLMLDYTRVLYADLLEIRGSMAERRVPDGTEPTLDEVTAAFEQQPPAAAVPVQAPAFVREQAAPVAVPVARSAPAKPATTVPSPVNVQRGDIREYIDLNDKYLFLGEFFGNDLRAYEEAMNHLNSLQSEQEAIQYLGHKLQENDAANALKNVLNRFYLAI